MSKLLLFCIVTCLFALCWSKSTLIQLEDKPGYCNYEGIYIKEGEDSPSPLGTCNKNHCTSGNPLSISTLTCAVFQPRPGCHIGDHDYTKLYPACCPKEVC